MSALKTISETDPITSQDKPVLKIEQNFLTISCIFIFGFLFINKGLEKRNMAF